MTTLPHFEPSIDGRLELYCDPSGSGELFSSSLIVNINKFTTAWTVKTLYSFYLVEYIGSDS